MRRVTRLTRPIRGTRRVGLAPFLPWWPCRSPRRRCLPGAVAFALSNRARRSPPGPVSGSAFRVAVSNWQRPEEPFAGAGPRVRIQFPPPASPNFSRQRAARPLWRAQGTIDRGWAKVENGDLTEGTSRLRGGMTAYAGACEIAGQIDLAVTLLDDALQIAERTGEYWQAAELIRHKGGLLLHQGQAEAAEGCRGTRTLDPLIKRSSARDRACRLDQNDY